MVEGRFAFRIRAYESLFFGCRGPGNPTPTARPPPRPGSVSCACRRPVWCGPSQPPTLSALSPLKGGLTPYPCPPPEVPDEPLSGVRGLPGLREKNHLLGLGKACECTPAPPKPNDDKVGDPTVFPDHPKMVNNIGQIIIDVTGTVVYVGKIVPQNVRQN